MLEHWQRWQRRLARGLGIGLLSLGLAGISSMALRAAAQTTETPQQIAQTAGSAALVDGIYFFGQVPEPGSIGREYLVFNVRDGRVQGAIYAPRSEYSCFTGTADGGLLALDIVDPYDDQVYPYAIALERRTMLTAGQVQRVTSLAGHHRINTLRELEYQLLDACRS